MGGGYFFLIVIFFLFLIIYQCMNLKNAFRKYPFTIQAMSIYSLGVTLNKVLIGLDMFESFLNKYKYFILP